MAEDSNNIADFAFHPWTQDRERTGESDWKQPLKCNARSFICDECGAGQSDPAYPPGCPNCGNSKFHKCRVVCRADGPGRQEARRASAGRAGAQRISKIMKERPIRMTGEDVRAILEGRKTNARRVVKPQPPGMPEPDCHPRHDQKHPTPYIDAYCNQRRTAENPRGMSDNWCWWQVDDRQCLPTFRCPYGKMGDRLWVRETWKPTGLLSDAKPSLTQACGRFAYAADEQQEPRDARIPWRPSIHLPRWASRLALEITGIRVERLQAISEEDAIAEGIELLEGEYNRRDFTGIWRNYDRSEPSPYWRNPRDSFKSLWVSIYGRDSLASNPWVWVLQFRKL